MFSLLSRICAPAGAAFCFSDIPKHRSGRRRALSGGMGLVLSLALPGCSHHPSIEDVSPLRTEKIVQHVRCEARSTIVRQLMQEHHLASEAELIKKAKKFQQVAQDLNEKSRDNPDLKLPDWIESSKENKKFLSQMEVAIAYDFDFNITEDNTASGAVGFQMPFVAPAALDLGANAKLTMTRAGQRQFKAQETWSAIIQKVEACKRVELRDAKLDYPVTGRSGMDAVITTFLEIHRQGVSKDSFFETLTFTTEIGGGLTSGLKLSPLKDNLRLVSASASLTGTRRDVHKMVVSMIFPQEFVVGRGRHSLLDAPFDRPPKWRARYNLCVADSRQREDKFNALHHLPPELYCIKYAESFIGPDAYASVTRPTGAKQADPKQQEKRPGKKAGQRSGDPTNYSADFKVQQKTEPHPDAEGFRGLYYRKVPSYLNIN